MDLTSGESGDEEEMICNFDLEAQNIMCSYAHYLKNLLIVPFFRDVINVKRILLLLLLLLLFFFFVFFFVYGVDARPDQ